MTRKTNLEFSQATRSAVAGRAKNRCEVAHSGCVGGIHHYHHRRLKTQGGEGTEANCLALCHRCHLPLIHNNVAWSYRHGLLVKSYNDPADVGVWTGCDLACETDHAGQ